MHDTGPADARQARRLVTAADTGTLATISAGHDGWPFASVTPYGLDAAGNPTLLLSSLAEHTRNLLRDPRASLLVTGGQADKTPLESPRATLLGTVASVAPEQRDEIQERYIERHPEAAQWVSFGDFAFYRLDVHEAYLVGGFGSMSWITGEEYRHVETEQ